MPQEAQPPLHMDACNSLLHLALSLHGQRELVFHAARADAGGGSGAWQHRQAAFSCQQYLLRQCGQVAQLQEIVLVQRCGDAYLSSPTMFLHRVRYPECHWQQHILAVQMRLLVTTEEFWALDQRFKEPHFADDVSSILSHHIGQHVLEMPCMQHCLHALEELRCRASQPRAVVVTCRAGLKFHTADCITRICATSSSAEQAGARIGDALFGVGQSIVWGVGAEHIGHFFIGHAGADVQITVIRGSFTVDNVDGHPQAAQQQFLKLTLTRDTLLPQKEVIHITPSEETI